MPPQIADRSEYGVISGADSCWRPSTFDWTRTGAVIALGGFSPEVEVDNTDALFRQEKAAFTSLLPTLLPRYEGQFVAIHGGRVVDSDVSRVSLTRRFFKRFSDTSVYIGYVGRPEPVSYQVSPFKF